MHVKFAAAYRKSSRSVDTVFHSFDHCRLDVLQQRHFLSLEKLFGSALVVGSGPKGAGVHGGRLQTSHVGRDVPNQVALDLEKLLCGYLVSFVQNNPDLLCKNNVLIREKVYSIV